MSSAALIYADPVLISGTGPYPIPHEYSASGDIIAAAVASDNSIVWIDNADLTLDPLSSDTNGNLYLSAAAAATYDGATLYIRRATSVVQDWSGVDGAREISLQRQLDLQARSLQDIREKLARAVTIFDSPIPEVPPFPDRALTWNADGTALEAGPTAAEISSAQTYAEQAGASKDAAASSAAEAALYDGPRVDDVPALLANTALTLTTGQPGTVAVGDFVQTRKKGFAYQVADASATDHDIVTAGGLKLYVVSGNSGYPAAAFGEGSDGLAAAVAWQIAGNDKTVFLDPDGTNLSFTLSTQGHLKGGTIVASGFSAINAHDGTILDDVAITVDGAVQVGMHILGNIALRDVSVDMTGSTAVGGRHAIATTTDPAEWIDVNGLKILAPDGYGFLPNETAPPSRLLLTHFDVKAKADALEFNYPATAGADHVVVGGILYAGEGGTASTAGFAAGLAHVDGFVLSGVLSRHSRGETIHIEDGCRFGVVTGVVGKKCQSDGFWGGIGGYGDNQGDGTPIIHNAFSYEFTGTETLAAGIWNIYDTKGFNNYWTHTSGYISGFPIGVRLEGKKNVIIVDDVVVENCGSAVKVAGSPVHSGTVFSKGCNVLVKALSNNDRPRIDRVISRHNTPTSETIFSYPSSEPKARATVRGFEVLAVGANAALAASAETAVKLLKAPRKFMGNVAVHGTAAANFVGYFEVHYDGTTLTTVNKITDSDGGPVVISGSGISISGGYVNLAIYNAGGRTNLSDLVMEFDGMWIE